MKKKIFGMVAAFLFVDYAALAYIGDKQVEDAPADPSQVVTVPEYPKEGRKFEIRRTYQTNRSSRIHRATPPEGYIETLIVRDGQGKLEFRREGRYIHTIYLGKCFSLAKMDDGHDFQAQGSPSFVTTPPDCRVWDGRTWQQTYKTLVPGWFAPCVYESRRQAKISRDGDQMLVRSSEDIHMTMEKNGKTYDFSHEVVFDNTLGFFRTFDVGYVGKVEVLREIAGE